ncbi:MAG: SpoIIIAH-like family protein [Erysipelotrichaceae bacterium]|nr:SpoIIIAH-like family protein [Erysipelotrichaceae bacterium]MDY3934550.1 SpoIIIAH-like family protein [Bacilli bacterium]
MIKKKNLWFLTLFSLVLVLSVYYVTMPNELLVANNSSNTVKEEKVLIEEANIIETLKSEDNNNTLEEINKLKTTIADSKTSAEDRNKAFDELKLLNQISSKEELLEEKIKNTHNLDSFIKIDGDQVRVVIDSDEHSNTLANKIMRTVQDNFDTKQYISVQFK